MDESSESRSSQYDPTMDYHWQQFELRRLKGSSEDFQQLFEDIMVRARPGFTRVRPYGKDGDRKCDGLFQQDGIFFQVYSPDELKQAQVCKKINDDLDGAISHWGDELKTWAFVYNVKRGVPPDIPKTLQEKQTQYPPIKIEHLSNDALWEIARELTTQQRSEIFGAPPSEKRSQTETNWRETCQVLLEQWKGLTTNALTKPDGVQFQLEDVFVPLGVVEKRQKSRHAHFEGSPERGSELYEEKVTPISHNNFFENVLRQGQSQYSQGKRIAIIGEPGAGKTTQLQKIGDWILQETDGIPIWIPLSAVGEKGLKDYLYQGWLKDAIFESDATEHHRNDLAQLLKAGKVWLLLDGADEMTVADALQHIATQIRGMWLQNVRVVLTCRSNVWEARKNALDNFDVYCNLDFEYPNEVHQFIGKWFQDEPNFQQTLKASLEQPGKERIRDMVKNPLRLTLLCYSWQIHQGELPETKAGLYEWFLDAFYEWNKGKVPYKLTSEKRKELNQALGELAREAIDQHSSRFRLTGKFIIRFLGDTDDEDSLFQLALQLGWLNRIGVAAENPFENVYAFLHPTFQEYFAALAIKSWDYFLPRTHDDHPVDNSYGEIRYRIFDAHWREVLLLWIGHSTQAEPEIRHEDFINKLVNFEDGLGGFFHFQSNFALADMSRGLFDGDVSEVNTEKLFEWTFGTIDKEHPLQKRKKPIDSVRSSARIALSKLPYSIKLNAIENRFSIDDLKNLDQDEGIDLAYILGESENIDSRGISILSLLGDSKFILVSTRANEILENREFTRGKDSQLKDRPQESPLLAEAETSLPESEKLTCMLETLWREMDSLREVSRELAKIESVDYLKEYLKSCNQRYIRMRIIFRLSEIINRKPEMLSSITQLTNEMEDEEVFELVAWLIGQTSMGDFNSVESLIDIFEKSQKYLTLEETSKSLKKVDQESLLCLLVNNLKQFLSLNFYNHQPLKYSFAFEIMWSCAQKMSYPTFYKAWHSS
jgi:energy-coupling factor transporter ATP-binding protein EcfA2